jgi:hypothetical protein
MKNEHDANRALFEASINSTIKRATLSAQRNNKAQANNGSVTYWRQQQANRVNNSRSWDILTKWIVNC